MSDRRRARGLTLIELMVATALGLALLTGVAQIYLATKTTYRVGQALARIQEGARFATLALAADLRMAGNLGCETAARRAPRVRARVGRWRSDPPLSGYEGQPTGWHIAPPAAVRRRAAPASDIVTARFGSADRHPLARPMAQRTDPIALRDRPAWLRDGARLVVADCLAADVFRVTGVRRAADRWLVGHDRSGNVTARLTESYDRRAEVMRAERRTYFVATGPSGEPALYRRSAGRAAALVAGVENLQITYGEDRDGGPRRRVDAFIAADRVRDWSRVVAVRVAVLMRSAEPVAPTPSEVTFDGRTYRGHRLRRTFEITVALRNAMP